MTTPLPDPLELRGSVIAARSAYRRGEITIDDLYAIVDRYIDACAAKAKVKWPQRRFRRPSRGYLLRAL